MRRSTPGWHRSSQASSPRLKAANSSWTIAEFSRLIAGRGSRTALPRLAGARAAGWRRARAEGARADAEVGGEGAREVRRAREAPARGDRAHAHSAHPRIAQVS